ncbi:hypothetical protein ACFE04_005997 [Oxalis oulophora]
MANAVNPNSKRNQILRFVAIGILVLIVLVGLVVLISWLIVKPKRFRYSIEDGWVRDFNISKTNHLDATFDFVLRAHNPNGRVAIYYDTMEVSIAYEDQTIAFNTIQPFHQGHHNVTRMPISLVARDVPLPAPTSKDLWRDKKYHKIELDVHIKSRIHYKVGRIKSKHRTMRIDCSPVMANVATAKSYQKTNCEVDID